MPDDPKRSKLKKYIGKKLEYEGTISFHNGSILLQNVEQDGKLLTNHIWASVTDKMKALDHGSEVVFNATAYSYVDSKNERKYGLTKIHNIHPKVQTLTQKDIVNNMKNKQMRTKGNKKL
jgi:hypothetical protein